MKFFFTNVSFVKKCLGNIQVLRNHCMVGRYETFGYDWLRKKYRVGRSISLNYYVTHLVKISSPIIG